MQQTIKQDYQIIAQRRDNSLTIKQLSTGNHIVMSATQIAHNPTLMNGFNPHDACIIGFIAGDK